eukprot:TRINITY_DN12627_c1_g2_i6.p1 TRINITY_DN12627_c1_g2~~TRINITY_DN12627_c1_g2_i6.p1  ORF type:complete len:112 (-),score=9.60 TRINITY_DN12627_c1_g2_i6:121-456(-)
MTCRQVNSISELAHVAWRLMTDRVDKNRRRRGRGVKGACHEMCFKQSDMYLVGMSRQLSLIGVASVRSHLGRLGHLSPAPCASFVYKAQVTLGLRQMAESLSLALIMSGLC